MNILFISNGDNGGGCWWQAEAIRNHTEHNAISVRQTDSYIGFPVDHLDPSAQKLHELAQWADIIHGRDTTVIDHKKYGKPTLVTYTGRSYRRKPQQFTNWCKQNHVTRCVSTVDMMAYTPDDHPIWIPNIRPEVEDSDDKHDTFTACHAPTFRDRKGTDTWVAACKKASIPIDVIENTSHTECMERKARCHVLLDQFAFGYGGNAIEAWGMGMPVVSGVQSYVYGVEVLAQYNKLPYILAKEDVNAIADILVRLRDDEDYYNDARSRGIAFYYEFHSPQAVADRLVSLYESLLRTTPTKRISRSAETPIFCLQVGQWDYAGIGGQLSQALRENTSYHSTSVRLEKSTLGFPVDFEQPPDAMVTALWNRADIVHVHDAVKGTLAHNHKPTVITYHGTKYRNAPAALSRVARERNYLETVATPDLTLVADLPWMPDCRPDLSHYVDRSDEFSVCHAPTKRNVKGTETVIAACKKAGVTLDLIEGQPWRECLKRKGRSWLVIDQFQLGYGCNAIEGWSMELPVIAGGSPPILSRIEELLGFIPFSDCQEDVEQLVKLIVRFRGDNKFYNKWVDTGKLAYESYHSPLACSERALHFYEQLLSPPPASDFHESAHVPANLVAIRYLGSNRGLETYRGSVTHSRYKFSASERVKYVDQDDVLGLLGLVENRGRDRGKRIFEVV
jgi:hypothetical protein